MSGVADPSLRDELDALVATRGDDPSFREGVAAAMAAFERREAARLARAAIGIAKNKADGKKTGGDVPYGFQLDDDGETLVARPQEQKVIRFVRKLHAEGWSFRKIAKELAKEKLHPRNYNPTAERPQDQHIEFHAGQLWRMVQGDR